MEMKYILADTAFAIGVLAGTMFTGASEREIDRLERGLVYSIAASPWLRKET
jgi:hypothetical protein